MKKILLTASLMLSAIVFSKAQTTPTGLTTPVSLAFNTTSKGAKFYVTDGTGTNSQDSAGSLIIKATDVAWYVNVGYALNDGAGNYIGINVANGAYIAVWARASDSVRLRIDPASVSGAGIRGRIANAQGLTTDTLTTVSTRYDLGPYNVFQQEFGSNNGSVDSTYISSLEFIITPIDTHTVAGTHVSTYTGTVWIDSLVISQMPVPTAVKNPYLAATTNLYPNPASNYAYVNYSLNEGANVQFTISDMTGRPVSQTAETFQGAGNSTQTLSISNLEQGIYNVTYIINGSAAKIDKLVVK